MSKGFVARCANSSAMAESTFGTGSVQKTDTRQIRGCYLDEGKFLQTDGRRPR